VVPFGGLAGFLPEIPVWSAGWADRNGCPQESQQERVTADVVRVWWEGCPEGADVEFYVVEGGLHGWPGTSSGSRLLNSTDTINATDVIWEFLAAHPS
jgi:polyhydroxybutyrate depolymerase